MFVRSHHSLRSLAPQRSALLRSLHLLAPFTSYLTHFAHFLVETVEIHKHVLTLKTHFTESLEILVDNKKAQYMISFRPKTAKKRRRIDGWADGQANE